jgi:hypothetical protein
MCASDLEALYRATETDLSYALGVLALPELGVVPVLQIFYATWTREMLTAIQAPLARGLELVSSVASDGTSELHLSTREQVALRVTQAGQTFVWQAPAWEAHLTGVATGSLARFEAECRRCGLYWLVLRTPAWTCFVQVQYPAGTTQVGVIEPCSSP